MNDRQTRSVERALSMMCRKDEVLGKPIGTLALGVGSILALISGFLALLASYFACLVLFAMFAIATGLGSPDPDPSLIALFSFWYMSILGSIALVFFIPATLILKLNWWKSRFWRIAGFIGLILLVVLVCWAIVDVQVRWNGPSRY